jgi:rifampicin phosphotransferase
MTTNLPSIIPDFITGLMAGMVSFQALRVLATRWLPEMRDRIPEMILLAMRGLPNNVTSAMDLALFAASRRILANADGSAYLMNSSVESIAMAFRDGSLPANAQNAIADFLAVYGMRGLAEIDLGRPRWRDDPAPVIQSLLSYLTMEDGPRAPDRVFARGQGESEQVLAELFRRVRSRRFGGGKEKVLRFFASRMRALMGIRESPKFYIIRLMGCQREGLQDSGRWLAECGKLDQADDIFWLHWEELEAIAEGRGFGGKELIAARRASFAREQRRRRIPRLLLSDGRAIYESAPPTGPSPQLLTGDPVSPGVAEGSARVIRDPRGARLLPGEILVCPGTDPSWTPLFLAAGGLVMEVGGMMTHGSVVAREYGLPAVVGVDHATELLASGTMIRVDGSHGTVEIIHPPEKGGLP